MLRSLLYSLILLPSASINSNWHVSHRERDLTSDSLMPSRAHMISPLRPSQSCVPLRSFHYFRVHQNRLLLVSSNSGKFPNIEYSSQAQLKAIELFCHGVDVLEGIQSDERRPPVQSLGEAVFDLVPSIYRYMLHDKASAINLRCRPLGQ